MGGEHGHPGELVLWSQGWYHHAFDETCLHGQHDPHGASLCGMCCQSRLCLSLLWAAQVV